MKPVSTNMIELDSLIFENEDIKRLYEWQSSRKGRLLFWTPFATFCLLFLLAPLSKHSYATELVMFAGITSCLIVLLLWSLFILRLGWRRESLHKRLDEINDTGHPSKALLAIRLYGSDWRMALAECNLAHIGGECPLCGAE